MLSAGVPAAGSWRLLASGCWLLVAGGCWRLVAGWRLAANGWLLVTRGVVSGWRLVAGWRLAVALLVVLGGIQKFVFSKKCMWGFVQIL